MARTGRPKAELTVTDAERRDAGAVVRGGRSRRRRWRCGAGSCWRVPSGTPNTQVAAELGVLRRRSASGAAVSSPRRLDGLVDEHRPGRPPSITSGPGRGGGGGDAGVDADATRRTGRGRRWPTGQGCRSRRSGGSGGRFGLKPHLTDTFKLSTDPLFVEKVVDVVGLYHNPPERAVVLCVDEKSQIQALDRSQPVLPMMPGMPERRTHDYARNGITSLFAAFNIADGTVISELHRQHRAIEFKQVPDHDRQDRARGAGRPPDLRQLRHPQDPGDQGLAGPAPPLPHALHPDRLVLDQPGRTLVRLPHRPDASAAASTRASKPSKPTSAPGSPTGTPTRSRSSGPRPPRRSSTPSADIFNEFPAQDTRRLWPAVGDSQHPIMR